MCKKNRNNIEFPRDFMKEMKKKKHKKMRNFPIDDVIIEKKYNDAERTL